ncbi:MAG: CCA tRNA nucleotidyltransferase, partial [Anaerolineae bacterium]|nr:CCA tRNA nucleotidyltransferase [Anaerolineae bacterium]
MRSLADFSGQWVVIDSDHNVVASGDTPHEARQSAAETQQELGLSLGWVAPYSPQVVLPYWPLQPVIELASTGIWLAGGAVRDLLMGRSPRDWDFVVPRQGIVLARAVANAMDGAFYVLDAERGIGRALVREPSTGEPTFLDFAEMRGPTLEDDLQLRDFTVNAMSLTMDGRLNDPTGGQEDLAERRIRLTHCGSLLQDPVRLVRAVRIAVELDFEIAPETAKQIQIDAPAVVGVAAERLRDELVKLFALAHADRGLQLLSDLGLLARILPEAIPDAAVRRDVADRTAPPGARRGQLLQTSKVLIRAASTDAEAQDSIPNLAAELADLTAMTRDFRQDLAAYLSGHLGAGLTRGDLAPWCAL